MRLAVAVMGAVNRFERLRVQVRDVVEAARLDAHRNAHRLAARADQEVASLTILRALVEDLEAEAREVNAYADRVEPGLFAPEDSRCPSG